MPRTDAATSARMAKQRRRDTKQVGKLFLTLRPTKQIEDDRSRCVVESLRRGDGRLYLLGRGDWW